MFTKIYFSTRNSTTMEMRAYDGQNRGTSQRAQHYIAVKPARVIIYAESKYKHEGMGIANAQCSGSVSRQKQVSGKYKVSGNERSSDENIKQFKSIRNYEYLTRKIVL